MDRLENRDRTETYRLPEDDQRFLELLNQGLGPLERRLRHEIQESASHPLVIIGGVQRSGTTLMAQTMARYCRIAYINNFIARFFDAPLVGVRLHHVLRDVFRTTSAADFTSDYGLTSGVEGPHEFGYFWAKRLRLDECTTHFLTDAEASRVDWEGLVRCIRQMVRLFGLPLVFKNPIAAFNAHRLFSLLPELHVVLMQRDPFFLIQSTYLARQKRYGTAAQWWSLKPPSYPDLARKADPFEQVAGQVLESQDVFARLQTQYPGRCVAVQYQTLRQDPHGALGELCCRLGIEYAPGDRAFGVDHLPDGDRVTVSADDAQRIRAAMKKWLAGGRGTMR